MSTRRMDRATPLQMRNEVVRQLDRVARRLGPLVVFVAIIGCDRAPAASESLAAENAAAENAAEHTAVSPIEAAVSPPAVASIKVAPTADAVVDVAASVSAATTAAVVKSDTAVKARSGAAQPTDTTAPAVSAASAKGADASSATYSAWLESSGTQQSGKPGSATVVLVAKSPYKCNDAYPYKFTVDKGSSGVTYPQDVVRGMQVSPTRSTMAIPYVPSAVGPATISGTLFFSVCTEERCLVEQAKLSITVDVR